MNMCTVDVQKNWRGNQTPTSKDNIQTWETQRKTTTDKTLKNTQTTHKQHGLPMEREWTQVFRKSKQFLPIAIHLPYMFMKDTTHILVEEEKGLKHKKHPEMGKKLKVWNKQTFNVVFVYTVFFIHTLVWLLILFFYFSDDVMCPIRSFFIYKEHLNPKSDTFFQRPKVRPTNNVWYDVSPLGHNSLGKMVPDIC